MDRELVIIGHIRSTITDPDTAPKMEDQPGAVRATIELDPAYADGLDSMAPGAELDLLTWLHKASRTVLKVHPRGKEDLPKRGVFTTRSPARPNPIGLHQVTLVDRPAPTTLVVEPLEAIDGTPVIDIKPRKKDEKQQ